MQITDLRLFLINIQCYKFYSRHCWHLTCLICYIFIFIYFLLFFYLSSCFTHELFRNLISKCLGIFLLLVFTFVSIMVKEHTLCNINSFKFLKVYFLAYLGDCSRGALVKGAFCCRWMQCSVYVHEILLMDVLFRSLLADFFHVVLTFAERRWTAF